MDYLNENIEEFLPVFSYLQRDKNDQVEIGEVSVNDVRILESGIVAIDYEYEWSFFAGCKDIKAGGIESETIEAQLVGGMVRLTVPEHPEPRTTLDEL
jgi:hypothetical protein